MGNTLRVSQPTHRLSELQICFARGPRGTFRYRPLLNLPSWGARGFTQVFLRNRFVKWRVCALVETLLKYYRSLPVEHFTSTRVQRTNATYSCIRLHIYLYIYAFSYFVLSVCFTHFKHTRLRASAVWTSRTKDTKDLLTDVDDSIVTSGKTTLRWEE